MAIHEPFFKKLQRERGEFSDVFQYEVLSEKCRNQLVVLMETYVGNSHSSFNSNSSTAQLGNRVFNIMRGELGVQKLVPIKGRQLNPYEQLLKYICYEEDITKVISVLQLVIIDLESWGGSTSREAAETFNIRMKENGIGYQYNEGEIIKLSSEHLHTESVLIALNLLSDAEYANANEEYRSAFSELKSGEYSKCLVDACKALESVLKVICVKRGWASNSDNLSTLISACLANNLIPSYWQSNFTGLRSTLEASVNVARNRAGAHGQGTTPYDVPEYMAMYVLHITASAMIFLTKAESELP